MNFKIVVSDPKERKAYQKEVDQKASGLIGRKIGEIAPGDLLGLNGYKLEITGGSDKQGFPMRRDIEGTVRKKVLLSTPPGFHPERKGQRKRKSVRGNTISTEIVQVNMKIVEYGKKPVAELFGVKKEEAKESKEEAKPEKEAEKEKPVEKEGTKKEEVKKEGTESKKESEETQKQEAKPEEDKKEQKPEKEKNEETKEEKSKEKEETPKNK
jgi:small subunit ribosomal protein S6e